MEEATPKKLLSKTRIILKWMLKKQKVRLCAALNWVKVRTSSGVFWKVRLCAALNWVKVRTSSGVFWKSWWNFWVYKLQVIYLFTEWETVRFSKTILVFGVSLVVSLHDVLIYVKNCVHDVMRRGSIDPA